jgi:hypothetical protein
MCAGALHTSTHIVIGSSPPSSPMRLRVTATLYRMRRHGADVHVASHARALHRSPVFCILRAAKVPAISRARTVMSPTPNIAMRALPCCFTFTFMLVLAACGSSSSSSAGPDAAAPCAPPSGGAPTYTELFTRYFAPGTPGHCANDACHNGNFNIWECGFTKDSCYQGMVMAGIINTTTSNPTASPIGDPKLSPLRWINPNGPMPFDTPGPFPEGRDAILAWVAACAQNN